MPLPEGKGENVYRRYFLISAVPLCAVSCNLVKPRRVFIGKVIRYVVCALVNMSFEPREKEKNYAALHNGVFKSFSESYA